MANIRRKLTVTT